MNNVAVYGSLKQGFGNHRLLERGQAKFMGTGFTVRDDFAMYSLGAFPGVVKGGATDIQVELYEVDDATFANLDRLEGHPNFYCREEVSFEMRDGELVTAWMYIYQGDTSRCQSIETGEW